MHIIPLLIFLNIFDDQISARVVTDKCPDVCQCGGTSASCVVSDGTLATVLKSLPQNLTKLNLSRSVLTVLKKGALEKFNHLISLYLEDNGDDFTIDEAAFDDTPFLQTLHLARNPGITSYQFLRKLHHLRELSVDSLVTCTRCNYTRVPRNQSCPGDCAPGEESPFAEDYCACADCIEIMVAPNCSQTYSTLSPLLGNSTLVRVALWLTSSLALVSNLALIGSRCYGHTLRQKPLSVFIAGIALSNLFITASVVALLVADVNQSSGVTIALDPDTLSDGTCGAIYFLKHFGIYSLVLMLCFVVTQRCTNLGYHRCFASEISVRRACLYIGEAWVFAFLLILPWRRVSKWHRLCTASYETLFAKVMYFVSCCLVVGLCILSLVQVAVLFWRLVRSNKLNLHKETRMDLGLISATLLTSIFLGIPHSVVVFGHFDRALSPEDGAEIVTILLVVLCALYPFFLVHYYPNMSCLDDSASCACTKCKMDTKRHYCPRQHQLDPHRSQKSTITLSSFQESCNIKVHSATVTTTASVERMSEDSLIDIEPWRSPTCKTKHWVESCDYDDLKKLRAQTRTQSTKLSSFSEIETKPISNGESSTSGVNDVSSVGSMVTTSERTSSFREAIHEHALLEPVPREEATTGQRAESDGGKTSDSRASRRLGSIKGFLQSALSARRQRSKSLPEKREVRVKKCERSQSVPFGRIPSGKTSPLDKSSPPFVPSNIDISGISVTVYPAEEADLVSPGPGGSEHASLEMDEDSRVCPQDAKDLQTCELDHVNPQGDKPDHSCKERLASFFVISPAKHKQCSPRKTQKTDNTPLSPPKTSIAGKIAKSFALGRKSPLQGEPAAKVITLEDGDILTELPATRRQRTRPNPRDPTARDSMSSIGSARFSLEWDPIGSMEGYADCEVLPPNPSVLPGVTNAPKFPKQPPVIPRSCDTLPAERISSYSLDWDPTSVQLRNSVISRDSLCSGDLSDDAASTCDMEDTEGEEEISVWV